MEEVKTKSRLTKGLDNTVIPEIGTLLLTSNLELGSAKEKYGRLFTTMNDEFMEKAVEGKSKDEAIKIFEKRELAFSEGLKWLVKNRKTLTHIKNKNGVDIFRMLGEELEAFGKSDLTSWPGKRVYETEEGYELWRNHCSKHGRAIADGDSKEFVEAMKWLSEWHRDITD